MSRRRPLLFQPRHRPSTLPPPRNKPRLLPLSRKKKAPAPPNLQTSSVNTAQQDYIREGNESNNQRNKGRPERIEVDVHVGKQHLCQCTNSSSVWESRVCSCVQDEAPPPSG
ncbi:hypothetical protein JOB18_010577 [Solea senegalensis]|uniref:Uncharacterized protein n=1 Tax=Solea senegalensis TaxID=28829 RepID=A0AAV6PXP9_SOLSE|nr:hypothetical protein JOB18_010577 [Solea senegalensis]